MSLAKGMSGSRRSATFWIVANALASIKIPVGRQSPYLVDTILDHLGVIEFLDRELGEAFNHLLQAENQIVPLVEKTLITKPDHGVGQADRIPAGETDGKVGQKIHFPGTESSDHPEVDKGNPIARQDE